MNCKECRAHILTDYLDNELSGEIRQKMADHLSSCRGCKEFAAVAQKAVIEPFEKSERAAPPEIVWENIKKEIAVAGMGNDAGWFEEFKNALFPRPAFAFVAMAGLVLMFIVLIPGKKQANLVKNRNVYFQDAAQKKEKEFRLDLSEQDEYVAYLLDENNGSETYGTFIEEYFL